MTGKPKHANDPRDGAAHRSGSAPEQNGSVRHYPRVPATRDVPTERIEGSKSMRESGSKRR